jgi:hypothetical protein
VPGSLFAHGSVPLCRVFECIHIVFVLSFHCTLQALDVSVQTVFRHARARSATAHTAVWSPTVAAVGPTRCAGQRAVPSGEPVARSVCPSLYCSGAIHACSVGLPLAALHQAPALRTLRAHPCPSMKLKGRGGQATDIP